MENGRKMGITELDKEIEEAANVERNVGDELAVFPISLDGDSDIHGVGDASCSSHRSALSLSNPQDLPNPTVTNLLRVLELFLLSK